MTHPETKRNWPDALPPDASPMDIAGCITLSSEARRTLLEEWRDDELAIARAASEGMDSGPSPCLATIEKALHTLDETRDA